jgi:CBS domain-containing protein
MSDFDDALDASPADEMLPDARAVLHADALDDTIAVLNPAEPVCLPPTATVAEAAQAMLARRQAGVLVVDRERRLQGIFTERDVLTRVVGARRDPARTALADVMTSEPEALTPDHRVAYALHCMSVAGYRTVPLIDHEARVIGVITVTDVVKWLANLFPEEILNLPPGDRIKHPEKIDAG